MNHFCRILRVYSWHILIILLLGFLCVSCRDQSTSSATTEDDDITVYSSVPNDIISDYFAIFNDNDITVYSSIPSDIVGDYLAAFNAEYPEINVRLVNGVTLKLIERLLEEEDDPQADVVWGLAVSSMLNLEWNYLLTMYTPTGIERIDPRFVDDEQPPQWVGVSARSIVLCINQDELRNRNLPMPESWQDLINSRYRGHLLILNPGETTVGYLLISTILQLNGDILGWEYLAQLHENVEGVYANHARGVCKLVLNGDYPIGLTYDYRAYLPNEPNMTLVFPKEGVGWDLEVNGLVRKERIKTGSKIFLDWAISDQAMQQYAQDRLITTAETELETRPGIDASELSSYLYDLDIAWIAANRVRIQEQWLELYGDEIELIDTSQ